MFTFHRVDIAHLLSLRRVRQSWRRDLAAPSLPRAPVVKSGAFRVGVAYVGTTTRTVKVR